ncbi:hypothetical protein AC249_AIPGENE2406 [Exaiptasia diaphana]|nr:hypothetical protein AC249_AIPGENE2406 [Exaiptasia diaphana]
MKFCILMVCFLVVVSVLPSSASVETELASILQILRPLHRDIAVMLTMLQKGDRVRDPENDATKQRYENWGNENKPNWG